MGNVTLIFALKRALDGLKFNFQNNFSIRQIMCSFHFQMMLHWAGTFSIWFPISTDMSEVLGHIPEKSNLLVMQPLGPFTGAFCLDQWFTTPFNTPWPPCREANSTGPSTELHLGDDADNFLEDPEVVARAGLITERLG
jgi:hypothetical protein